MRNGWWLLVAIVFAIPLGLNAPRVGDDPASAVLTVVSAIGLVVTGLGWWRARSRMRPGPPPGSGTVPPPPPGPRVE